MSYRQLLLGCALGLLSLNSVTAADYPAHLFAVNELHFDATRQACDLDCIVRNRKDDVGLAIATYMGVHEDYVLLSGMIPNAVPQGESTHYAIPVTDGYSYCSSSILLSSVMSASADAARGTLVVARVNASLGGAGGKPGVELMTWTGTPKDGEGQSSAEGYVKVTGIKHAYFEEFKRKGVCANLPAPGTTITLLECRGSDSCRSQGIPEHRGTATVARPAKKRHVVKAVPELAEAPDGGF